MIEIVKESFQQNYKINRLFAKRLSSLVEKILEIAPRPLNRSPTAVVQTRWTSQQIIVGLGELRNIQWQKLLRVFFAADIVTF